MRRYSFRFLAFLTAVLLAAGVSCAEGLREDADNFFAHPDPQYEKLIDRVEKCSHRNNFTGSILIATDDEILLYGGPKAVTTAGEPADLYTTYDIGSCSKLFTATAVFQLIDAGKIALDDPLTRFFPAYETGAGITVWHLLHMQSGIPDEVNDPVSFWQLSGPEELDTFMPRYFRDAFSDEEFLAALCAAPLIFEPGTQQEYSNTNYHLLAMIVEQVSGQRFCDYLQEHVFDPCGLEHTSSMVIGDETSVPRLFYDLLDSGIVNENGYSQSPNTERGAGGIHTCTADLWAFDRALLAGQLVSDASLAEMMNFDKDYGCGLYPTEANGYGHSGRNGCYTSWNLIFETQQFGRVYFIIATASDAGTYGLDAIVKTISPLLSRY
ncbi:MAG: beta-lactamase family protein [Clostridia bacterium]|nr:beta-lactamase family protein [Clostridia bacterium]